MKSKTNTIEYDSRDFTLSCSSSMSSVYTSGSSDSNTSLDYSSSEFDDSSSSRLTSGVVFPGLSLMRQDAVRMKKSYMTELVVSEKYDKVKHYWTNKAFYHTKINTFLGSIREERMEQIIKKERDGLKQKGALDKEGLILTSVGRSYTSQIQALFSVKDTSSLDPSQVMHLDGVWLSKVYSGNIIDMPDWVEDIKNYVKKYHGRVLSRRREVFAFDPTLDNENKDSQKAVIVFFVKIID